MPVDTISGHLLTAGTALAGLVLVFLGQVFTSYDGYDATEKKSVRSKYQTRGVLALIGFLLAGVSAALGYWASWSGSPGVAWVGSVSLAAAFVFVVIVAVASVQDLFRG